MIPKGFPHHLRHFFHPNSTDFTHFGPHFEAYMVAFSCVLATPRSENLDFLKKKIDPKRLPESSKRLPKSSKSSNYPNHPNHPNHFSRGRRCTRQS